MDVKPFSQACMNNREPILRVLERVFASASHVLEVGSGTGQHAVYFAKAMPHLQWQTSDLPENLPGIRLWLEDEPHDNLPTPLALDVNKSFPNAGFDAVFSANTAHIMPWPTVEQFFQQVADTLPPGGVFALYGPFNYEGAYTSESNARFDTWLKAQNPDRGIRDFEKVDAMAGRLGLVLQEDNAMPANNRLLVWRKQP
jgi:cyclopropane fatty-acyl-phospholipid synthase-like methyltransferase